MILIRDFVAGSDMANDVLSILNSFQIDRVVARLKSQYKDLGYVVPYEGYEVRFCSSDAFDWWIWKFEKDLSDSVEFL